MVNIFFSQIHWRLKVCISLHILRISKNLMIIQPTKQILVVSDNYFQIIYVANLYYIFSNKQILGSFLQDNFAFKFTQPYDHNFTSSCLQEGSCLFDVICVCLRIVVSNTYCVVCFLFCFSYHMLLFCLDCPFLIATSIFFNIYFHPPVSVLSFCKLGNNIVFGTSKLESNVYCMVFCKFKVTAQISNCTLMMVTVKCSVNLTQLTSKKMILENNMVD